MRSVYFAKHVFYVYMPSSRHSSHQATLILCGLFPMQAHIYCCMYKYIMFSFEYEMCVCPLLIMHLLRFPSSAQWSRFFFFCCLVCSFNVSSLLHNVFAQLEHGNKQRQQQLVRNKNRKRADRKTHYEGSHDDLERSVHHSNTSNWNVTYEHLAGMYDSFSARFPTSLSHLFSFSLLYGRPTYQFYVCVCVCECLRELAYHFGKKFKNSYTHKFNQIM